MNPPLLCLRSECTNKFNYGADMRIRDSNTKRCVYIKSHAKTNQRLELSNECDDEKSQFFYNKDRVFMSESLKDHCITSAEGGYEKKPSEGSGLVLKGLCRGIHTIFNFLSG